MLILLTLAAKIKIRRVIRVGEPEIIKQFTADPSRNICQNLWPACIIREDDTEEDRRIPIPIMTDRISYPDNLAGKTQSGVMYLLVEML